MRLTDYADRLEALLDDGYSLAQARRLAGSGQRLPLEPAEDAADEDEEQEPGDMQGTAEGVLGAGKGVPVSDPRLVDVFNLLDEAHVSEDCVMDSLLPVIQKHNTRVDQAIESLTFILNELQGRRSKEG